jgi:hypothetical protein
MSEALPLMASGAEIRAWAEAKMRAECPWMFPDPNPFPRIRLYSGRNTRAMIVPSPRSQASTT